MKNTKLLKIFKNIRSKGSQLMVKISRLFPTVPKCMYVQLESKHENPLGAKHARCKTCIICSITRIHEMQQKRS